MNARAEDVKESISPAEAAAAIIDRARTDPVWLFETGYGVDLDPWQRDLLNALADPVRKHYGLPTKINHAGCTKVTVRAMHGPGKTFGAAMAIHWFGLCFKTLSPATAPKLDQLKNRLWPNVRKLRGMANDYIKSIIDVRTTEIIFYGDPDWKFVAETGKSPENLQGYHDEFMLIVVDEATGIEESMFPVIESALSTGVICLLLLIGNPTKTIGTFADSHLKPSVSKYYYKQHVSLDKTTRVSHKWVKEMEDKYGKDSPVVKIRCYGDFAADDANQLISVQWVEEARYAPRPDDGSWPRRRMSIDVADGGTDFSVVSIADHYQSFTLGVRQLQYNFAGGESVSKLSKEAIRLWSEFGFDKGRGDDIVVDGLGVGAGVVSILQEAGYPVVRYIGGSQSDDTTLWRNRRTQSYLVGRDELRDGKVVFAEDFIDEHEWDDFTAQLCAVRRKPGQERLEDLLTKEEMKKMGIASPDRADSWIMQYATQAPMGEIIVDNFGFGKATETSRYDGALT